MVSRADAVNRLLTVRKAADSYLGFVKAIHPNFVLAPFQLELIDVLDRLERGTLKNAAGHPVRKVLITMPPRHAKSTFCTQDFPVYYAARKPGRKVISASYNAKLAHNFGRMARDIAREPIIGQAFPGFALSDDSKAVNDWRATNGSRYYATSTDGDLSGRAATLFITDDPIKNRTEAESPTYRDRRWQDYISASTTRLEPEPDGTPPIEIMILTRWHPDDPAGRLMQTEDWETSWHHVNFPAITTKETDEKMSAKDLPPSDPRHIPMNVALREVAVSKRYVNVVRRVALWPERFPLEELLRKQALDEREFEALYQQSPYIRGGNLIKISQFRRFDTLPQMATVIIAADTAFKKTETSDFSVFGVWGMDVGGDIYLIDVIRRRLDFAELKREAISLNARWRSRALRGLYVEDKASGQSLIQELRRESGLAVIPHRVSTDKVSRVHSILPMIEGGRVFIPQSAPWLDDYLIELEQFPDGAKDDQVDMTSMALDVLSRTGSNASFNMNTPIAMDTSLNSMMKPLSGAASPGWGDSGFGNKRGFSKDTWDSLK